MDGVVASGPFAPTQPTTPGSALDPVLTARRQATCSLPSTLRGHWMP
jgi:hypothetical protein